MRKPHLELAKATYEAAEEAVKNAKNLLEYTQVRAPYDGVVIRRNVNPGQAVLVGEELGELISTEALEIPVPLDAAQWSMLPPTLQEVEAMVSEPQTGATWQARAVRAAGHLDEQSRQRTLFLRVFQPYHAAPPLLPGTFVKVHLDGRVVSGMLCIPESALTKQGLVWYVDEENRLRSWHARPLFHQKGRACVRFPLDLSSPLRIAVFPNTSFTNGLLVQPIEYQEGR